MLGGTGGHAAGLQRRPRPVQEAEPRQESQHRRYDVPDAGEVLEQSRGADTRTDRTVGHREEEDGTVAESYAAQVRTYVCMYIICRFVCLCVCTYPLRGQRWK